MGIELKNLTGSDATALKVALAALLRTVDIPAGLGWDQTSYPVAPTISGLGGKDTASAGYNPFASADYLACRAGPQYFVSSSGSDSNDGSEASPFSTLQKALTVAKAGAVAATVFVLNSTTKLARNQSTFNITDPLTAPIAIVAKNGRVPVGPYDSTLSWAANATYAWVSQAARSSVVQVADLFEPDRFGNRRLYTKVSTLLACSQSPGTYYDDATNIYVNPFPGVTVSNSTVRAYLNVACWTFNMTGSAFSVFITGDTALDGFDFEGGGQVASLRVAGPTAVSTQRIFAVKNCTFRHGGGANTTSGGVYVEGWPGLFYYENCYGGGTWSDVYNFHNVTNVNQMYVLGVNNEGDDAGRGPTTTSNNLLTGHDDKLHMIELAPRFRFARGATVHLINNAKLLIAGGSVGGSVGDVSHGGAFSPTEFKADNSAEIWIDGVNIQPFAGKGGLSGQATSTAAIRYRNMLPGVIVAEGSAVVAAY